MLLFHDIRTIQFAFYSVDGEFEEGTKGESVLKEQVQGGIQGHIFLREIKS